MKIDDSVVFRLQKLAKLKLDEAEKMAIKGDLNNMLAMIETLQEVDTEGVEPLIYVNENETVREDRVVREITHTEALQNSPDSEGPFFKVPKVLNV